MQFSLKEGGENDETCKCKRIEVHKNVVKKFAY